MAKPRKTELPDEVIAWMNEDMENETTSGKGNDEEENASPEGIGATGFTNSPLVTYTKLSPFKNSPRNQPISKIIIHHMAGVASVESFGTIVTTPGREMSANYAIGNDGRIGLYCPEEDRCWCSSSAWVDNRGIAIEVVLQSGNLPFLFRCFLIGLSNRRLICVVHWSSFTIFSVRTIRRCAPLAASTSVII